MKYKRKSFTARLNVLLINPRLQQCHSVLCLSYNIWSFLKGPLVSTMSAPDDNVIFWREAFRTILLDLSSGVTWADGDRWTCLFFFFTGCLSLNAGTGPSSTNNIYFAMRRVQGVCKLELLFFLLCPCSTLKPPTLSAQECCLVFTILSKEHLIWFLTCRALTPRVWPAQYNMPTSSELFKQYK